MEAKRNSSRLWGLVQEANLQVRVDWLALSKRLGELKDVTPNEAFEFLASRGILSPESRAGYYIILDNQRKNISPEGYCFTQEQYARQFIVAVYHNKDVHLARIVN